MLQGEPSDKDERAEGRPVEEAAAEGSAKDSEAREGMQAPSVLDEEFEEGFGWFAVHTYSGYEKSVEKAIEYLRETYNLQDKIKRVYLPTEQVKSRRSNGKEYKRERPLFPGYVFVKLRVEDEEPDAEVVKRVTGAPKVIGFVRAGQRPQSFTEEEMRAIEESKEQRRRAGATEVPFRPGDRVKIVEGLFAPFTGAVEDVFAEKRRLKVIVGIFGRPIPVELSFEQVELAEDED